MKMVAGQFTMCRDRGGREGFLSEVRCRGKTRNCLPVGPALLRRTGSDKIATGARLGRPWCSQKRSKGPPSFQFLLFQLQL